MMSGNTNFSHEMLLFFQTPLWSALSRFTEMPKQGAVETLQTVELPTLSMARRVSPMENEGSGSLASRLGNVYLTYLRYFKF